MAAASLCYRESHAVQSFSFVMVRHTSMHEALGHTRSLPILRLVKPGAFLALDPEDRGESAPCVLLPNAELPESAQVGDTLDVFLYLDSSDRLIATLRTPHLELGEVAFLTVTDVTSIGAFVAWGLVKELLVPFSEQTRPLSVGDRHPFGLYLDKSGRLAATMRVSEMLEAARGQFEQDEWVHGEAWRRDPEIGLFVIVERAFVGLLPASEPHRLQRGEGARFRVTNVLADGKIELSLRGHAHEELDRDATRIYETLARRPALRVGDQTGPDEIRALFGLSKKAFKRALGRLLKQERVQLDAQGYVVVAREPAPAGTPAPRSRPHDPTKRRP